MLPPFEPWTGPLLSGIHEAIWEELVARFGWTPHRLTLLAELEAALNALRLADCWETDGVEPALLDPVLVTFDPYRRVRKAKYGGEKFFADAPADPTGMAFIDFFQRDRSGHRKGIVALDLRALP